MFKRILVPLDGSKLAELALPYAEELAGVFDAELNFLYVCEPAHKQHRYEYQVYIDKIAELVRNRIEEERPPAKVKAAALIGHPAAVIIEYANENGVNLIIMATHGRSGIMAWTMGSITNKVLRRVSMPLLLIRAGVPTPKAGQGKIINKILVPLDGSDAGEAALPYVRELTEKLEAEVILLQVVTPGRHVHTIGGLDYVRFDGHEISSMEAKAREYLEQVSGKLTGTKATVRSEVKIGDAAQEIIKFGDEISTRLVAMSSHGRSGIERWTFGSITHKVLHAGNTPVLVVRAQEAKV